MTGRPSGEAPDVTAVLGPHALVQTGVREPSRWAVGRLDAVLLAATADGWAVEHLHRPQARPDAAWSEPVRLATDATAAPAAAWLDAGPGRGLHVVWPTGSGPVHHAPGAGPALLQGPPHRPGPPEHVAAVGAGDTLHVLLVTDGRTHHVTWTAAGGWRSGGDLAGICTGPPTLAASGGGLVAVLPTGAGIVAHRWEGRQWRRLGVVAPVGTAAASLAPDGPGVLLAVPCDDLLALWAGRPRDGWEPAGTVRPGGTRVAAVALASTALGSWRRGGRGGGWLQALVQEGGSVVQLHRQQRRPPGDPPGVPHRWTRAGCLRDVAEGPSAWAAGPSVKLAQVSGDTDTQPWADGPRPTLSPSSATAGVRGTDLGVRVDVAGATLLLCGDTHWTRRSLGTRDAVARVTPDGPSGLPGIVFHGGPVALRGRATMREYDVPLDAFELDGRWFLFASSHHFARHQTMGRSVLARALADPAAIDPRSRRPLPFRVLTTVSDFRFVNIACQWVGAAELGLEGGRILALWGSGSYRADDLRLAVLDPAGRAELLAGDRPFAPRELGLRFWAGIRGGRPVWSAYESDAAPVLRGAFGEVSVRWVKPLGRYVLLGMTGPGDPAGRAVWLRTAPTPWGPWSPRLLLLDWIADGQCRDEPARRFIRALAEGDPVGDAIFRVQARSTGGAYAPYLFDARVDGADVVIRYTLSTWNPYQIVLMEHRLPPDDLAALGVDR